MKWNDIFANFSFFEHLERISGPDYLPTDADVLRARVRTTGITQTEFSIQGVPFSCVSPARRSPRA